MEYDHEGQKTSKRNLENENLIICDSVKEKVSSATPDWQTLEKDKLGSHELNRKGQTV